MLNLAGASDGFLIAGFASFLPKLIENQFSVTASSAALLIGQSEPLFSFIFFPQTGRISKKLCKS